MQAPPLLQVLLLLTDTSTAEVEVLGERRRTCRHTTVIFHHGQKDTSQDAGEDDAAAQERPSV